MSGFLYIDLQNVSASVGEVDYELEIFNDELVNNLLQNKKPIVVENVTVPLLGNISSFLLSSVYMEVDGGIIVGTGAASFGVNSAAIQLAVGVINNRKVVTLIILPTKL